MKVFVADSIEKGFVSPTDYHWCDDGDLLMFGQFQLGNGNPSEVAMCGIQSRKFTTHIVVKNLNIDIDFYKELLTESIEKAMGIVIDRNGGYKIEMGWLHHFNINDIMYELHDKACRFRDGQKVRCMGRTLFPLTPTFDEVKLYFTKYYKSLQATTAQSCDEYGAYYPKWIPTTWISKYFGFKNREILKILSRWEKELLVESKRRSNWVEWSILLLDGYIPHPKYADYVLLDMSKYERNK